MRERIPTCTPMFRACMAGRFARDLLYVNRLNPFIQERSLLSYGAVEQQMSEEERMRWGCRCCCGQQVAACWPACPDADNSGSITPPPCKQRSDPRADRAAHSLSVARPASLRQGAKEDHNQGREEGRPPSVGGDDETHAPRDDCTRIPSYCFCQSLSWMLLRCLCR